MLIVDAHLDLAHNALKYGRDPRLSLETLRAREEPDLERGVATVSLAALRAGGVRIIFGTLFTAPLATALRFGSDARLTYRTPDEAHRVALAQLDYYRRLADDATSDVRLVTDAASLAEVVEAGKGERPLLGIVPLMEGADPIREPAELEAWVARGLRAIGLAWDDTRYASGAWRGARTGLTAAGRALLEAMAEHNLMLDLTHMSEIAALEALDRYPGPIVATHSNARALVPNERQASDAQIVGIGERGGVIGVVLYNAFLRAGYVKGDPKARVTLDHVAAHVDHICQLLGSADHVGVGSDFDGGFGAEDIPLELDSAADLPRLGDRLRAYGYAPADVAKIMGGNWLRVLRDALPG